MWGFPINSDLTVQQFSGIKKKKKREREREGGERAREKAGKAKQRYKFFRKRLS